MQNVQKKYIIKIPNNITILYSNKKQILNVVGSLKKKSLKIKVKLLVSNNEKTITVSSLAFSKTSNDEKKNLKTIQGTTVALIKQAILETSNLLYRKLRLIGIGYKVFEYKDFKGRLLLLKLGYSHPIYFKIPSRLKIFCLKSTKLFLYGNSYQEVSQAASTIRCYKKPEPYKGKGILYETEKIILKESKKV